MKLILVKSKMIVLAIIVITNATSCMNYYKISSSKGANAIDNTASNIRSKNYIVHFKDTSYALNNASVSNSTLAGSLAPLRDLQIKYLHPSSIKRNRYIAKDARDVFSQVHIFVETVDAPQQMQLSIPLNAISEIITYKKNQGATTGSHLLGVGITLAVLIGIGGIMAESAFGNLYP